MTRHRPSSDRDFHLAAMLCKFINATSSLARQKPAIRTSAEEPALGDFKTFKNYKKARQVRDAG